MRNERIDKRRNQKGRKNIEWELRTLLMLRKKKARREN